MAVIRDLDYIDPESWASRGMDWTNPDPVRFDYVNAILLAIRERQAIVGAGNQTELSLAASLYSPILTRSATDKNSENLGLLCKRVRAALRDLAPKFYNASKLENAHEIEAADEDDFRLTWNDLVLAFPALGAPPCACSWQDNFRDFLKACKGALDMMTICELGLRRGVPMIDYTTEEKEGSGSGSSAGDAFDSAESNFNSARITTRNDRGTVLPSPAVSYNVYMVKTSSKPWYNSSIKVCRFEIQRLLYSHLNVAIMLLIHAKKMQGSNARETIFDSADTGLSEGFNVRRVSSFPYELGSFDALPSYLEINQIAQTNSGFEADITVLCDYGVEGGFKFFSGGDERVSVPKCSGGN